MDSTDIPAEVFVAICNACFIQSFNLTSAVRMSFAKLFNGMKHTILHSI